MWIAVYGPVPPGLAPYHLCHGGPRGCIRPSHLDIAQEGATIERGHDPRVNPNTFRSRIRDERTARQATAGQFAKELGVAKKTLVSWEQGLTEPTTDQHARISRRLGWDEPKQKWIVTAVVQQVVLVRGAGAAARETLDDLEREEGDRKAAIYKVVKASQQQRVPQRRPTHPQPVRTQDELERRERARTRARLKRAP